MNNKILNQTRRLAFNAKWSFAIFSLAFCFLSSVNWAHDEIPGDDQKNPIVLINGTVHPISSPAIENGMILFHKGKIVAVGKKVKVPENAKVIDVKGKHVFPSLFEAHSQIGLIEIGAVRSTDDRNEIGSINPNVKAQVAVNPDSEVIPVTRSNGVLLALTAPSGSIVSGKSAVIQLDGWTYEDMTVKGVAAMNVVWPSVGSAIPFTSTSPSFRRGRRGGGSNGDSIQILRKLFEDTRAYKKALLSGSASFKHDLRLEAMVPVVDGQLPMMVEANDLQQIQSAVAFASEQKAKLIILGGYDAPLCAQLLKKHDVPVILSAVYRMPRRRNDDYDAAYTLPVRLQKLGVKYCISGTDRSETWNARILPDHAGTAVAYGLEKDEALKAITLYPAQILGVDNQVGSLDVGKDATLFVSTASPLNIANQVEAAFVQGRHVELNDRHKRLYKKYEEKYRQKAVPK